MPVRYPAFLRVIHWFMAITIIALFALGLYMSGADGDPNRMLYYGLHKSFGVLIVFLVVLRIVVRMATKAPKLPARFPKWEVGMAHAAHFLLYVLMFAVPMAGIWMSNSGGHPVQMFGIPIPALFPKDKEMGALAHEAHELLAFAIIGVACLHAAGVVKHRFIDKHDILYRMGFGKIPAHATSQSEEV